MKNRSLGGAADIEVGENKKTIPRWAIFGKKRKNKKRNSPEADYKSQMKWKGEPTSSLPVAEGERQKPREFG